MKVAWCNFELETDCCLVQRRAMAIRIDQNKHFDTVFIFNNVIFFCEICYFFLGYANNNKKSCIRETTNLSACAGSSTNTKRQKKRGDLLHPTHCGPTPMRNTLLTVDRPHRGTPYALWTYPTAEGATSP